MTVQQDHPTTTVTLPAPRSADHDGQAPAPPRVVPDLGAWGTAADRRACLWMVAAMLALGLFAAFMVTLSARVW